MLYTFYSDYHFLTPMALDNDMPKNYEEVLAQNAYYIGDNVDKRGSGERQESDILIALYKGIFQDHFVSGNHEAITTDLFIKKDNLLIIHGDVPIYGIEKSMERRSKTTVSKFGWLQSMFAGLRKVIPYVYSDSKLQKIADYTKSFDCNTVVFGHTHTGKVRKLSWDGVTIINVPRGKTTLDL